MKFMIQAGYTCKRIFFVLFADPSQPQTEDSSLISNNTGFNAKPKSNSTFTRLREIVLKRYNEINDKALYKNSVDKSRLLHFVDEVYGQSASHLPDFKLKDSDLVHMVLQSFTDSEAYR